ncbi:MAG: SIS domain-containing protein [Anaerolineaceae bacterium]|nr:SIS domain-containing protein [Anaerolineaceae bacterium]
MSLHSEIREQPDKIRSLLAVQKETAVRIARAIQKRQVRYVFLAARGTSDNAGRYANYLLGAQNGLPLALATPSLFTYYKQPPVLKDALVIGISQSGRSPDIVSVLVEARRQGCPTLTITNEPGSPLAGVADFVLALGAGREKAVAATKTYTGELMAIALLSTALSGEQKAWGELERVAGWMETALEADASVAEAVQRYHDIDQTVVLGRGFNYATAFEWALKRKELSYIIAEPYSSADFLHGPIAMLERGFPVMAVAPRGRVFKPMLSMIRRLKHDFQAEVVVISNDAQALALAATPLPIPSDVPEWLSPLVNILPAQLFAYHLTKIKGFDPDHPRSIQKVTETR